MVFPEDEQLDRNQLGGKIIYLLKNRIQYMEAAFYT
jgi:hypothetical protein